MAKEVPLYKDKKYIALLEKVKAKLDKGLAEGLIGDDKYGRTFNALITQPDKAFVDKINKHINDPVKLFVKRFKTKEDTLLREHQPIVGMEGHHIFHQNTVKRLRNLPIAKQLEVMHKFRKLGGTSGVGSSTKNVMYLGKWGHRANLLKDKVNEVTAHINPFNLKDDTTFWGKDYQFNPNQTTDEIADALYNEAYGPQSMLAKNARLRKSEVAARNWFKKTLGGVDIFDPKINPTLRNKYKAVLNELGVNFNDVARAFEEGNPPELPNKGKPIPIIQALKNNPSIISETNIGNIGKQGKILKSLKQLGLAKIVTGAPKVVASQFDLFIPDKKVADAFKEKEWKKGLKMYGNQIGEDILTTGLFSGITKLIMTKGGAGAVVAGAPAAVPLTVAATAYQFKRLDDNVFDGAGQKALDDTKHSYLNPLLGEEAVKEGTRQYEKNKEKDPLGSFAMPF